MSNRRVRWAIALVVMAGAAAGAYGPLRGRPAGAAESASTALAAAGGQKLEGSWRLNIMVTNPPGMTFRLLATATPEGALIGSAQSPYFSTAHGAWKRTGNRQFAVTAFWFRSDAAAAFQGTTKVRGTLRANQGLTEATGQFHVDLFDPKGAPVGSFSGEGEANRIQVEALP
jgi:hypothetical protein